MELGQANIWTNRPTGTLLGLGSGGSAPALSPAALSPEGHPPRREQSFLPTDVIFDLNEPTTLKGNFGQLHVSGCTIIGNDNYIVGDDNKAYGVRNKFEGKNNQLVSSLESLVAPPQRQQQQRTLGQFGIPVEMRIVEFTQMDDGHARTVERLRMYQEWTDMDDDTNVSGTAPSRLLPSSFSSSSNSGLRRSPGMPNLNKLLTKSSTNETKQQEKPSSCSICMDAPSTVFMVPCGHVCMCLKCVQNDALKKANFKCPMCRQAITDVNQIFPS